MRCRRQVASTPSTIKGDSSDEEDVFGMPCTRPRSRRTKLFFPPKSWCRYICPVLKLAATAGDHRRKPGCASVLATKIEACSKSSLKKKQLNKLQKGSESPFSNRGVGAEVGLYYKKDGTWERCVIRRLHAQVNRILVEAGLQVENV